MVSPSGWLIIEKDYRVLVTFACAVHPHIAFGAGTPAVPDHFKGCLICVDDAGIKKSFVHFIIYG